MDKIVLKIKAKDLRAKMGLKDGRDGKDGISIKGDKGDKGDSGKDARLPDISEIVKRTTDILTPLIPKTEEIVKRVPITSGYGGLNVYANGVKKGSMRTIDFVGATYSKVNGRDTLTTDLSGYVPYTGATDDVDLDTHFLTTEDIVKTTDGTLTYNGSGQLSTLVRNSFILTFTYNGDGTLATKSDGTHTWTYAYSGGNLASWAVT